MFMSALLANSELFATVNSELFLLDNIKMKYPEFAARFKRAWKELKAPIKTQKELAKLLGVAQATVSDWINGEKLPSMDTALEISEKLDCSVLWLLTGKTETTNIELTNSGYLEQANLTPEQLQAVKLIIAQFEQTNPVKAENKPLTLDDKNVCGGGR
jgi:transcriptional regulator with XRE-family HTH domain